MRRARSRAYAEANREKVRERGRDYYRKNAAEVGAKNAAYRRGRRRENRGYSLKHHYGMTIEQYEAMLERQGGLCASCGDPFEKTPHVDHNHETGVVRELLCGPCNLAVGHLKDSAPRAMALALYLERHIG